MSPSPPLYLKLGWRSWRACVLLQKKAKQRVPTLPFIFFPLLPLFPQLHQSSWSRRQTQSHFTPSCSEWSCEGSPRDQTGPGRVGQDLGPPGVHSHRGWALLPMPVGAHTQPGKVTARGKARCHPAVPSSSTLTCVLHSHPHRCFWLADLRSLHVSPIKCSPNVFPFGTSPDLLITSSW